MATRYTLRPCTDDDGPLLREIYYSTRDREMAASDWSPEQKFAFLKQQFEAQDAHYRTHFPDCEFRIIVAGGTDVGRLYLDRRADEFRIVDIALLPQHRGRGLGGRIMADIIARAEASDLPVGIHVERDNPARRLYERLGFERIQDDGIHCLMMRYPGT